MLWDKTKQFTADILIPHERAITLILRQQQWLAGDASFHLKFALKVTHPVRKKLTLTYFYNVSTIRDSEENSVAMNRKLTTGFTMSYRWSA